MALYWGLEQRKAKKTAPIAASAKQHFAWPNLQCHPRNSIATSNVVNASSNSILDHPIPRY